MYRKLGIFVVLIFCLAFPAIAQRRRPSVPGNVKTPVAVKPAEIDAAKWNLIAEAYQNENWTQAAELSAAAIASLKQENPKKQLARLRYLRLFALAGQILKLNDESKSAEAEVVWEMLDRDATAFVGQELIMPAREYLEDCAAKLNYLCAVKGQPNALRAAATDNEARSIHSFDYIRFEKPPKIDTSVAKVWVGGMLERSEFNDDASKPWVMRLYFTKGFFFRPTDQ